MKDSHHILIVQITSGIDFLIFYSDFPPLYYSNNRTRIITNSESSPSGSNLRLRAKRSFSSLKILCAFLSIENIMMANQKFIYSINAYILIDYSFSSVYHEFYT